MKNYSQQGGRLDYANTSTAIASGDMVVLQAAGTAGGISVAVAVNDIAATTGVGAVQIGGVFSFTGVAIETATVGTPAYWDSIAKKITTVSTSNTWAGVFSAVKVSADVKVYVLLNGIPFPY